MLLELIFSLMAMLRKDNLHIKDKTPAPNLSVIRKFRATVAIGRRIVGGGRGRGFQNFMNMFKLIYDPY